VLHGVKFVVWNYDWAFGPRRNRVSTLEETVENIKNGILNKLNIYEQDYPLETLEEVDIYIKKALVGFGVAVMMDSEVRKEVDEYLDQNKVT
jgi:hypothetical protein